MIESRTEKFRNTERPTCAICGKVSHWKSGSLGRHLKKEHNMEFYEYYLEFLYEEGIDESPTCNLCGKKTNWEHRIFSFRQYCSETCRNKCPERLEKAVKTTLKNHGYKYNVNQKDVKERSQNTCEINAFNNNQEVFIKRKVIERTREEQFEYMPPIMYVENGDVISSSTDDDMDGFEPI